jgi:hypothetical protein
MSGHRLRDVAISRLLAGLVRSGLGPVAVEPGSELGDVAEEGAFVA